MFTHRRAVRIEWGDCDPAGVLFYPRYFDLFDHSTVLLIEAALGMRKHRLYEHYGFAGHPSVGARAGFHHPARFGDDAVIESAFDKVGRSSFCIAHTMTIDGALAAEGYETRVWVVRDETSAFRAQPLPDEVAARFKATAQP